MFVIAYLLIGVIFGLITYIMANIMMGVHWSRFNPFGLTAYLLLNAVAGPFAAVGTFIISVVMFVESEWFNKMTDTTYEPFNKEDQ